MREKRCCVRPVSICSIKRKEYAGFMPEFFDVLKNGFDEFLKTQEEGNLKGEYLLPTIIGELLKENKVCVRVLKSCDKWFGVTYKEDKEFVVKEVKALIDKGLYPEK